jgi:PII-like signaling protein
MSLTNLNWYIQVIKIYRNNNDEVHTKQMYDAAVKYCNKCGIEISYLDSLISN